MFFGNIVHSKTKTVQMKNFKSKFKCQNSQYRASLACIEPIAELQTVDPHQICEPVCLEVGHSD